MFDLATPIKAEFGLHKSYCSRRKDIANHVFACRANTAEWVCSAISWMPSKYWRNKEYFSLGEPRFAWLESSSPIPIRPLWTIVRTFPRVPLCVVLTTWSSGRKNAFLTKPTDSFSRRETQVFICPTESQLFNLTVSRVAVLHLIKSNAFVSLTETKRKIRIKWTRLRRSHEN